MVLPGAAGAEKRRLGLALALACLQKGETGAEKSTIRDVEALGSRWMQQCSARCAGAFVLQMQRQSRDNPGPECPSMAYKARGLTREGRDRFRCDVSLMSRLDEGGYFKAASIPILTRKWSLQK